MKLIVGLGNPGDKYQNTRHNLGFRVVDEFGRQITNSKFQISKNLKAEISKTENLILAKPQTFMNSSGDAIQVIAHFYKIPVEDIIVIHDDLDISLGKIKIRQGGSAAGHHGVESIIEKLGTDQFIRVRLGIEPSSAVIHNPEKFVLESFDSSEKSKVKEMIKKGVDAVELILKKGLEISQNQYN